VWLLDGRVWTRVREGLRLLLRLVGESCWSAHGRVHGERKRGLLLVLLAELLILGIETSSEHLAKKGITKANESHGNPRGEESKKAHLRGLLLPGRCDVHAAAWSVLHLGLPHPGLVAKVGMAVLLGLELLAWLLLLLLLLLLAQLTLLRLLLLWLLLLLLL